MEKFLKLKGDKKLEVRFTPRTMARFQRDTKLSMGYFVQAVQLLSGFVNAEKMTMDDQAKALNTIGFDDLRKMILAGCPEVESLDKADEILDELDDGFFQNIAVLIEAFTEFLNGNLLEKPGAKADINPTPKPKPKKPIPEAEKKAG